jgi:phage replication O-like protein O
LLVIMGVKIASPQKENGFTPIANEIMDALCRTRIPGEERQVLDAILRKTYGWSKCEDKISMGQIAELTGMKRPNVARALKGLLSKQIALVIKSDNRGINTLKFNKNYEQWVLSKAITVIKSDNKSVIKNDNRGVIKSDTHKRKYKEKKEKNNTISKVQYLDSVFLADGEYVKLVEKYGKDATGKAIEILNNGIMSKGYKYKSHYHTIIGWPMREAQGNGSNRSGNSYGGARTPVEKTGRAKSDGEPYPIDFEA